MNHNRRHIARALIGALTLGAMLTTAACSGVRVGEQGGEGGIDADASDIVKACADYQPTTGITDDKITLGTSLPLTGFMASTSANRFGMNAYFEYVNETEGGIDGHELELKVLDDAYDPTKARANVQKLVDVDKVFAVITPLGTANILAFRDDVEEACVPTLLALSGASSVADADYDWLVPGLPSYAVEAAVLAQVAIKRSDVKTVAIIAQNDDFGSGYVDAFKAVATDGGLEVVDSETYEVTEPSVDSQVSKLVASGADAVFVAALGTKCPQILNAIGNSAWDPAVFVGTLCTQESLLSLLEPPVLADLMSTQWYKNPSDAQWDSDPAMEEFKNAVKKYEPEADTSEGDVMQGWLQAKIIVDIFKQSKELTREAVMNSAKNASIRVDALLDGISFVTGPDDNAPFESLQPVKFDSTVKLMRAIDSQSGDFLDERQTKLIAFEGKSSTLK